MKHIPKHSSKTEYASKDTDVSWKIYSGLEQLQFYYIFLAFLFFFFSSMKNSKVFLERNHLLLWLKEYLKLKCLDYEKAVSPVVALKNTIWAI